MWLHKLTDFIIRKRSLALVLTFLVGFVPLLNVMSIVVAAMVTLCVGIIEGLWFTIAATLPLILTFLFSIDKTLTLPLVVWASVSVAVMSNLITYGSAVMLKRQASWSTILQLAALMGVLVVSVLHLIYPDVSTWWGVQLQTYAKQAQTLAQPAISNSKTVLENQIEAINASKFFASGLMTIFILIDGFFQLIMARWWQSIVFTPGSLQQELHNIRLSHLAGLLFISSLVLTYFGNAVILDILPILYTLFAVAGLSVIHYLFGMLKTKSSWFWLAILYVMVLFSMPTSLMMLAIIALFDIWLDLRKRFKHLYMKN